MLDIGVNGLGWVLAGLFAVLSIALVIAISRRYAKIGQDVAAQATRTSQNPPGISISTRSMSPRSTFTSSGRLSIRVVT